MKTKIIVITAASITIVCLAYLILFDKNMFGTLFSKDIEYNYPTFTPKSDVSKIKLHSSDNNIIVLNDGTDGLNSTGIFEGTFNYNKKEYPLYATVSYDSENPNTPTTSKDSFWIKDNNSYELLFDATHKVNNDNQTIVFTVTGSGMNWHVYNEGDKIKLHKVE